MKKLAVEQAVGQTLCHDMTAILENGFKGVRFARGHVIAKEDLPVLRAMGKRHVFVWESGAGEVHEEDAARALAEALCGEGIASSGPSEGKISLSAARDGLFYVNKPALRAINGVGDYTVACRAGNTAVKKGDKLAGARIVPLVTGEERVRAAVGIARENFPVMSVLPFRPLKTAVIITGSEVYEGLIEDRFEPVLRAKLPAYGAQIIGVRKCPDELDRLLEAMEGFLAQGAELLLMTGGMSVDPDDLTPTAIRQSGARLVTQGVPMQPGNMLTLAYRGRAAIIGVPGASLHAKVTSLDVFLPLIFAGVELRPQDIAALGDGGLCLGCESCIFPRCAFGSAMGSISAMSV